MKSSFEIMKDKITRNESKMAVVGMGYVGLPLAVVFAEAGFTVTGIDLDEKKTASVNRGESYIPDIDSGRLKQLVDHRKFSAVSDFSVLQDIDLVSICVPTPLRKTGDPDLSFIISASELIAPYLHKNMVIVFESSTYPGTTREMVLPKLIEHHNLVVGEDFFLNFSPERIDPGRKDWTTKNTPKVMGGMTEKCTEIAALWYRKALDTVIPVSSPEVAEMTKLLENTYRMINIGLVNELALMCDRLNIDVWEVIDAAATKPFGFMKFLPGPGLGGHCIPIDPIYLSWKLKSLHYTARFIDLASEINTGMPRYTVGKVQDALNQHQKCLNGSKVLVLGAAYKPDIDDMRESPSLDVMHLLRQKGADVSYNDPYVPQLDLEGEKLESVTDLYTAIGEADCVVIVTNHSCYDYALINEKAKLIVDTRNGLGKLGKNNPKVVRL
ncbi:MAG: nucleotide sugar dehydrogenase [Flexilinea sp.]